MKHLEFFKNQTSLISQLGEGNAHLIFAMSLFLDISNMEELAADSLTDGKNDKKIDFLHIDQDSHRIIISQGFYSRKNREAAPSNKADDLNTAAAWLISGELESVPKNLRALIEECRKLIKEDEISQIDLLYVHNCPHSENVEKSLKTAEAHLNKLLEKIGIEGVKVQTKELGLFELEKLFNEANSSITLKEKITINSPAYTTESGPQWTAFPLSVSGQWLYELYKKYGDDLFSANYRNFLGADRRRKINNGIQGSAEKTPENFWVYNNGITILTNNVEETPDGLVLDGLSIINGAQTTGSLGNLQSSQFLEKVKVLARVIQCSDQDTISEIVKYNNTQNRITTWDRFSSDPKQMELRQQLHSYGHEYSIRRGFRATSRLGIENSLQPLLAVHGNYNDANRGKNTVFDRIAEYNDSFQNSSARHLLFCFALSESVDIIRLDLKSADYLKENQTKQLEVLNNFKFKYFLVSLASKLLSSFLGEPVDIRKISISPKYATASDYSINDLSNMLVPLTKTVLTFFTSIAKDEDIREFRKEEVYNRISELISAQIEVGVSIGTIDLSDTLKDILDTYN